MIHVSTQLRFIRKNVTHLATCGNGASGRTTRVEWPLALVVLCLVGCSLDARCDIRPGTIIERLLLTPEDFGVRILVEVRGKL